MMSLDGFWFVLLGCLAVCHAAPTVAPTASPEDTDLAEGYLAQFYSDIGTRNSSARNLIKPSFSQDLEAMQAFFGLEVTGVLNNDTIEVMKAPRCGVSDISRYGHFAGRPKWQKRLITYRIITYTPDLTQRQVDATIAQAFQLYSDVIPLDFKQIYRGTADIMILFKGGYHGDFYPFDGKFGVLAHAYAPGQGLGGDTHFDEDETWTLTQRGVNLLLVAAHEFGHALGLDHSRDRGALMFPFYQYVNTNGYRLPDDDRHGVQALYGSRTPVCKMKPKAPPEPEPEEPTEFLNFGGECWSWYDEGRIQTHSGYPRSIIQNFPGIGSKVDAAFENYGYLYFSSGPRQSEYYLPNKTVRRVLLNYGWLNCY